MDEKTAVCDACGIMGLPLEMNRSSLPIAGTLPTVPNKVTWTCKDERACTTRVAHKHRLDALATSDDPLYAAGNVLDRVRAGVQGFDRELAAVQDAIGRARVHYLQEPDEAAVGRAARVIAVRIAGEEQYAQDPRYHEAARAALKAALYNAEDPDDDVDLHDPGSPVPEEVLEAMADAMCVIDGSGARQATYFKLAKAAVAAIPTDLWATGDDPCIETRPSTRGDCDGVMVKAELRKPDAFGLPIGLSGGLVALCRSHWQQAYRAGEVGEITYPAHPSARVWIREDSRP